MARIVEIAPRLGANPEDEEENNSPKNSASPAAKNGSATKKSKATMKELVFF
jgi:hypothetical protein